MTELQKSASKYFKSTGHVSTWSNAQPDGNDNGKPPPRLESLFAEITKVNTTLQSVATDVSTIKETTTELKTMVAVLHGRLEEAETHIVGLEETSERLDAAEGMRSKQMEVMWERIQTLKNHSK